MDNNREEQLKQYMLAIPIRFKRSLYIFAIIEGIYLFLGLAGGSLTAIGGGALIALFLAALTFFGGFFKLQKKVRETLAHFAASGTLEEVLDDFEAGTQIDKLGCIGQNYFVGHGTGVLVDLRQVQQIRFVRETYRASGRRRYAHYLKFDVGGVLEEFVYLYNRKCTKRAREALTLLDGRIPMEDGVRQKYLS